MKYLDFEVKIASMPGVFGEYTVSVGRSPAGESEHDEHAKLPLNLAQLEATAAVLREAVHNARGRSRSDRIPIEVTESATEKARQFGQILFQAFFTGQIGELFRDSVRQVRNTPNTGLRIKLRADAPELSELPWEFLHDRRDFVCLSNVTPIVRYLPMAEPSPPLGVSGPLRILGMIASPQDLEELDVAKEQKIIERAFTYMRTQEKRDVSITWVSDQTYEALDKALSPNGGGPYHVFHFIGHGRKGELFLATNERRSRVDPITGIDLGRLLRDHRTMRLAVLNACYGARGTGTDPFSSVAASIVRQGLPAVVSMQHEVSDDGAIEFAKAFYSRVASGLPIDAAVSDARKGMSRLPFALEWATPVLHMRSPDGRLFEMQTEILAVSDVTKPVTKKKARQNRKSQQLATKKSKSSAGSSLPAALSQNSPPNDASRTPPEPSRVQRPNSPPVSLESLADLSRTPFSKPTVPLDSGSQNTPPSTSPPVAPSAPKLRATHSLIDFEERESGKTYRFQLGLTNAGQGQLSWTANVRGSVFKIKASEKGLDVFLEGTELGKHDGFLTIKSNGGDLTIPIRATLRAPAAATAAPANTKVNDAPKPVTRGGEPPKTEELKKESGWSSFFGCLVWIVIGFFIIKGCVDGAS